MKIVFTGATSFTGLWFVQELVKRGHSVLALIQKKEEDYSGIRKERLQKVKEICDVAFDCPFGTDRFLAEAKEYQPDLLCHHGAHVENYKSPDFCISSALEKNTLNLKKTLQTLSVKGVLLTGSVFEPNEGKGSSIAVSPYGLSKGLTWNVFDYFCQILHIPLAKFVIANPFGPFEEQRFTHFLIQQWKKGFTAEIQTPDYVRDNIHVSLLAKAYSRFAETFYDQKRGMKLNPSCYVETQKEFTERFSKQMEKKLVIPCPFVLKNQTEFLEPKVRVNTDILNWNDLNFNEEEAWEEIACWYKTR
jgi:nucleoside-diphosphate-sugar epimerase